MELENILKRDSSTKMINSQRLLIHIQF